MSIFKIFTTRPKIYWLAAIRTNQRVWRAWCLLSWDQWYARGKCNPICKWQETKVCVWLKSIWFWCNKFDSRNRISLASSNLWCDGRPPFLTVDAFLKSLFWWRFWFRWAHFLFSYRGYKNENFIFNKNPTRCNSMQIFIYCKVTLHVSGVTAPIIRSTKNCNRSRRYSYFPPTWPDRDVGK